MFAHTTTIWFVACPDPAEQLRRGLVADPDRTDDFIRRAYRGAVPSATASADLSSVPAADDVDVFAAHYGDLAVLAGRSLATTSPEELTEFVTGLEPGWTVVLLSLDPTASTGVFARWEDGRLLRAFAADPVRIHADHGVPFPFESSFWAGERPLEYLPGVEPDPLDLPFHPAELAEEANRQWLGFRFTPPAAEGDTDPSRIPLFTYRIGSDGTVAVPASEVRPAEPAPSPQNGPSAPGASDTGEGTPDATRTAPIAVTPNGSDDLSAPSAPAPANSAANSPAATTTSAPKKRGPGPISRYFGFRGRL
ncbi:DUF6928 family protein [Gordonia zhaorongruii]|uniref:DUF6928 family protein n=1 Tax=Gordonia zhaorongruii TaxID=2597659 RepID=UPI001044F259|nr:hypothetical protein [Gordonia zhaorongruii]